MELTLKKVSQSYNSLFAGLSLLVLILLSIPMLSEYFGFGLNETLALLCAPYILHPREERGKSLWLAVIAMISFVFYPVFEVHTFFYIGFACSAIAIIEGFFGRTNRLALYLVIASSPVTAYFIKVFGFPIRMHLTDLSSSLLRKVGFEVQNLGNEIILNGESFFVESACTGLKMLSTMFIVSFIFISYFERQKHKEFSHITIWLILVWSSLLTILANLMRIVGLIIFRAPEDTAGHELIGVLSMLFYAIVPLFFSLKWLPLEKKEVHTKLKPWFNQKLFYTLIAVCMIMAGLTSLNSKSNFMIDQEMNSQIVEIPGFKKSKVSFGNKFLSESALVYVKPSKHFWSPDHNPIICWKGSGYKFKNERIELINGREVFIAKLVKNEDKLYTAWWFTNYKTSTVSELNWRSEMAMGEGSVDLINVSASNQADLLKNISLLQGLSGQR